MEVNIWRSGQSYKVYSEDTGLIRQLGNAQDCTVSNSYFKNTKLVGLDCLLPFKAKFGRRIFKVLRKAGYKPIGMWPNLAQDEVLALNEEKGVDLEKVALNQGFEA